MPLSALLPAGTTGRALVEVPAGFQVVPVGGSAGGSEPWVRFAALVEDLGLQAAAAGALLCLLALDVTPRRQHVLTLAVTAGVADPAGEVAALAACASAEAASDPAARADVRTVQLPAGPAVVESCLEWVRVPGAPAREQGRFTLTLPTPGLTALLTLATSDPSSAEPGRLLAEAARTLRVEPGLGDGDR